MNWISSDFHINHSNIAGKNTSRWDDGYRIFNSVDEMNDTIINNVNKYVKWDDTLWFLGDFCFGGHHLTPKWRSMINCQTIHWIIGNHDEHAYKYVDDFTSVLDYWEGKIDSYKFVLMHYAMRVWNHSHKGVYHCYGHSHSSLEHTPYGRSMDVGIDNAYRLFKEYRPFSIEEVVKILSRRSIQIIDNHGKNDR